MAVDSKTREEQRALLEEALDSLLDSDGFARWLKVRQSFRTYSFNNQIMIMLQDPDATQVAGYSAWKKLERQVRQGERGIRIFAPCRYSEVDKETGEKRSVVRGFKLVSVFDVRQTDGEPLPELAGLEEVNGEGTAALWASLDSYCADLGFTLYREELRPGLGGYCHSGADGTERRIVLTTDPGYSEAALLRVYVHELVHAAGISYKDFGRQDCELLTDAAACLVLQTLGLDSVESSAAYLASWADGNRDKAKEWLGHACSVAKMVEDALGV